MRIKIRRRALCALLAALLLAGCGTTVRRHPKYSELKPKLRVAALLPPSVTVILVDTGDRVKRLPEEEAARLGHLSGLLAPELAKLDFDARWISPEGAGGGPDRLLDAQVAEIQKSFAAAERVLWKREARPEKKAYAYETTLAGPSAELAARVGATGILVSDFYQVRTTFSYDAKEFGRRFLVGAVLTAATLGYVVFIPAPRSSEGCVLEIALADAQSGVIAWANRASAGGRCREKTVAGLVEEVLDPYAAVF